MSSLHQPPWQPQPCPDFVGIAAPDAPIASRGELPHLYKGGGTYFVTFRLADAARPLRGPASSGLDIEGMARDAEPSLEAGECLLADPRLARCVESALLHFEGNRYMLHAWCVMPNHVHVVVTPLADHRLAAVLLSWKSFTAHQANGLLHRRGAFWERESFDHLIRSAESWARFVAYTEENPVVAGLCVEAGQWPYGSARYRGK